MLTADDRAQLLRDAAELRADAPVLLADQLCEVWRAPAEVNNITGAPVQVLDQVAIHVRSIQTRGAGYIELAPLGLSGARVGHIGRVLATVDIRIGDELRVYTGTSPRVYGERYKVEDANAKKVLRNLTLSGNSTQ